MPTVPEVALTVLAADILLEGSGDPLEGSPTSPEGSEPTQPPSEPRWHLVPALRWQYDLDDGSTVTLGIYAERIDGTDTGSYEVRAWGPWGESRYPDFDNPPNLWMSSPGVYCYSIDDASTKAAAFATASAPAAPTPPSDPGEGPISPPPTVPGGGPPLAGAGAGAGAGTGAGASAPARVALPSTDFVQSDLGAEVTRDLDLHKIKELGRGGDTDIVHVNEAEKAALKAMGGTGAVNPQTGLQEYNTGYQEDGVTWVYEEVFYAYGVNEGALAYQIITTPTQPREFWALNVYTRDGAEAYHRTFPVEGDSLDPPQALRTATSAWFEADAVEQQALIDAHNYDPDSYIIGDSELDPETEGQFWEGSLVDDAGNVFGETPDNTGRQVYIEYTDNLDAIMDGTVDSPFTILTMGGFAEVENGGNGFSRQGNNIQLNAENDIGENQEGWFKCVVKPGFRVVWEVDFDYQNARVDGTNEAEQDIDEAFTVYMESGDSMEFEYLTENHGNWGSRTRAGVTSLVLDGVERFNATPTVDLMLPVIEIKIDFTSGQFLYDPDDPGADDDPEIIDPDPKPEDPPECPSGFAWDETTNACVEIECPTGFEWDTTANACVEVTSSDDPESSLLIIGLVAVVLLGSAWLIFGRGVRE